MLGMLSTSIATRLYTTQQNSSHAWSVDANHGLHQDLRPFADRKWLIARSTVLRPLPVCLDAMMALNWPFA